MLHSLNMGFQKPGTPRKMPTSYNPSYGDPKYGAAHQKMHHQFLDRNSPHGDLRLEL